MRRLVFGVDFDDTYSADPAAMGEAIDALLQHGHRVVIVTGRGDFHSPKVERVIAERFGTRVPVVRCAHHGLGKVESALAEGFDVDIWWDDQPWGIKPTPEVKAWTDLKQKARADVGHMFEDDDSFADYVEHLHNVYAVLRGEKTFEEVGHTPSSRLLAAFQAVKEET